MDPISFTIGVVSIASIFQTCLHGYRSLNTAMAMGDAALTLNVQFRIEEVRLKMWGKNWGLLEEEAKEPNAPSGSNAESDTREESSKLEKPGAVLTEKAVAPLDVVDDEFEIPGLRDLTIEVLGRIDKALEEWKKVGEKYSVQQRKDVKKSSDSQDTIKLLSNIASKQAQETKAISKHTRITSKIRWALKDKQDLEELLGRLTGLNDSLEKLLPRKERTSLARGLASELLDLLENGTMNVSGLSIGDFSLIQGPDEVKAARIVRLKLSNNTERSERVDQEETEAGSANQEDPTPFAKPETWLQGSSEDMKIPFDHFVRLTEPKLKDYQTRDSDRNHGPTGNYIPLPRSMAVYAPVTSQSEVSIPTQASMEAIPQVTLIEWRPSAHESRKSELTEEELKQRRDHIARLLHRTSVTDGDFRILDCLGYTTTKAHVADGSTRDLVGYVYKFPEFASKKSLPVTLRELLGEAYASDNPAVPALEARFKLARELAIALYQLQCAGWVHRKVSSYNVIFFKDVDTDQVNLNQPFLVGWQYSRPDDQRRLFPSEQSYTGIGDLDMYVHRERLRRDKGDRLPRFRKSFDIYSLGIILIEIAFWEPIIALADEDEREEMEQYKEVSSRWRAKEWWKVISKTAKDELAPEMGNAYRDATLFCLEGGQIAKEAARQFDERAAEWRKTRDENDREKYFVDQDFEEVGIEKEFYWKVLKRLEKISI